MQKMIRQCLLISGFLITLFMAAAEFAFAGPAAGSPEAKSIAPPRADVGMDALNFLASQHARSWTRVPHRVMAFYYPWYGTPERHGRWIHWDTVNTRKYDIADSTHYPTRGPYDSHDPAVIDDHIDLAKQHGIDTFICSWWGPGSFTDAALTNILHRAGAKKMNISVYWESVPGTAEDRVTRAVRDLLYVLNNYASHPAFLKVKGAPVIFVYGRVMNQLTVEDWARVIAQVRRRYPRDFLLVADGYSNANAMLFDGIHTYNICGWAQGRKPDELRTTARDSFTRAVETARNCGKIACLTVIPGYDDTKIRTPGIAVDRRGGATYRVLWEEAIKADPDWILITSFNEWHEGSELEPSRELGDTCLKMTTPLARRFKTKRYSAPRQPKPSTEVPAEKIKALQKMYHKSPIAILPGHTGDVVLWLVRHGIPLKLLTWQSVVDRRTFNGRAFPVALFSGGERYIRTVRKPGDVDAALTRYLTDGGLLMAVPSGPFPFYYNETGSNVCAAGEFGFPILGTRAKFNESMSQYAHVTGWEKAPTGVAPFFNIDTAALPGLPRRVPYPKTGDLRWRPCTRALVSDVDVYLPLARLTDSKGRIYGDGVVYVEHKGSFPQRGKNIYVWMRMNDVLPTDILYYDLFRLAAEKRTEF